MNFSEFMANGQWNAKRSHATSLQHRVEHIISMTSNQHVAQKSIEARITVHPIFNKHFTFLLHSTSTCFTCLLTHNLIVLHQLSTCYPVDDLLIFSHFAAIKIDKNACKHLRLEVEAIQTKGMLGDFKVTHGNYSDHKLFNSGVRSDIKY